MSQPPSPSRNPKRPPARVVPLTPPGRGAIATLRIEGPGAVAMVESGFRPAGGRPLGSYPLRRIVFGHFCAGSHPGEDVIVCRLSEHAVELHCHGGYAAVERIRQALVRRGCQAVDWKQWTADRLGDPLAADAYAALADARTERTAAVLLDQYHGALRRAVEAVRSCLETGDVSAAGERLKALLARAEIGRHLASPWRVVLAGPPNVGKSSLINALVGYQRAIVHPAAGTTRDVVSAVTAIDGWPLELSDTAGLHGSEHPLEQAGIALARRQLDSADLVLLVFDSSQPWSSADQALRESRPTAMPVHNKCDLPPAEAATRPEGLWTSALTGQGIEELVRAIADRLVPDPPAPGAAVPFTAGQIQKIESAAEAVSSDPSFAAAVLGDLL